jgi:hypothetical protein
VDRHRHRGTWALGPALAKVPFESDGPSNAEATTMFILLAIILAVAWVLGFTVMKVSSLAIHILLALALASVVIHLFRRASNKST